MSEIRANGYTVPLTAKLYTNSLSDDYKEEVRGKWGTPPAPDFGFRISDLGDTPSPVRGVPLHPLVMQTFIKI